MQQKKSRLQDQTAPKLAGHYGLLITMWLSIVDCLFLVSIKHVPKRKNQQKAQQGEFTSDHCIRF
ncbi:MAG: hypothetical protein RL571_1856 [Pseudomonadota bacterium]|jgi:hypothetical protein